MPIEYALFLDEQFYHFNVVNSVINTKLWILSSINNAIMVLIVQKSLCRNTMAYTDIKEI